jgi:peptidoglycan/xylan/chitin deacetylase (PgdA/CDA1 family)
MPRSAIIAWIVILLFPNAAAAVECLTNPDALGTSRTITIDPAKLSRLGTLQYRETLPLKDHEVVLTFDDGPMPARTNLVLRILAHECVKATFFMIGRMAMSYPAIVRQVSAAGHTIGTHSQNHPLHFNKMQGVLAQKEIDDGIASVRSALGGTGAPAPFFRSPGLALNKSTEQQLVSRDLIIWGADVVADDWTNISPSQVYSRALKRLEARGRGTLLLHDIQLRTVEALPSLLRELNHRGFHVVHVVSVTSDRLTDVAGRLARDE